MLLVNMRSSFPQRLNLRPRAARSFYSLSSVHKRGATLDVHPEVQEALATNKPVVALETALVTHGFPYPGNVQLALSLEKIVRSQGSVPCTIGLIEGRVKIGLHQQELERLGSRENNPAKISRRDIAAAMALKSDGGTTCSSTLVFAALAGIKVFATGGLGGVHRGGENSMDVSADLGELTRCPVALVSAGVKSILDIPRHASFVPIFSFSLTIVQDFGVPRMSKVYFQGRGAYKNQETLGVPVLTYGPSSEFPAFFSRRSGVHAPWNVNDPVTAAKILCKSAPNFPVYFAHMVPLDNQWQLGMNNGVMFAVPIPEEFEEIGASIQQAVDQAVVESEMNGVSKLGKESTPWLLSRVGELTRGTSRASNIALIENTALVGGKIAVEYQKFLTESHLITPSIPQVVRRSSPINSPSSHRLNHLHKPANLMVIGSSAVDITAQTQEKTGALMSGSTAPGNVLLSLGGVARNIAEASHRVLSARYPKLSSLLVSPIGDDAFGRLLMKETTELGMRTDGFIPSPKQTAVCSMVLNSKGDLIGGVADMEITTTLETDSVVPLIDDHKPRLVVLDGNLSPDTLKGIVGYCVENGIQVFFEPTSVMKSTAIFPAVAASLNECHDQAPVTFISPNMLELSHLYSSAESYSLTSHSAWWRTIDDLSLGSTFRSTLERLSRCNVSDEEPSRGTLAFLVDHGVAQMAIKLLPFFRHLVIKCGEMGVLIVMRISGPGAISWAAMESDITHRRIIAHGTSKHSVVLQHFPPHFIQKVVNVTGAGDSFVGALVAILTQYPDTFCDPDTLSDAISISQNAAISSLQSNLAVSPLLSST